MGNCTQTPGGKRSIQQNLQYQQIQIEHLYLIFSDLKSRANSQGITRQQFDTFFRLNGLWCAEMFRKFDSAKDGYISFQEFLESIHIMVKGNWEQKCQILFDFYDVEKTNGIQFSQLTKMIYSYPKQQINEMITEQNFLKTIDSYQLNYYFDPQKKIFDKNILQNEEQDHKNFNESPFQLERSSSMTKSSSQNKNNFVTRSAQFKTKSIIFKNEQQIKRIGSHQSMRNSNTVNYKLTSNISSLVKKYVAYIFKKFKVDQYKGSINLEQFKILLKDHPLIFTLFFQGFHTYSWQAESNGLPIYRNMPAQIENQAYVIQNGKKSYRFLIHIKTTVFVFKSKKDIKPKQIITLQGLHVKDATLKDQPPCILIEHRDGVYQAKRFFFQTKQIKDSWMHHLSEFITTNIYDQYQKLENIGTGNFATVFSGIQKATKNKVAIKMIQKQKLTARQNQVIKKQCSILQLCHHPNIIKFYNQFQTKTHTYIITQYLNQGDLFQHVKKHIFLDQYQTAIIFKQLVDAIRYLNQLGLIHRDLKPQNIMIKLNKQKKIVHKIKIIDFGFALYKKELDMIPEEDKYAGTPGFAAPQILEGTQFDQSVDTFSLGIILYFMLSGYLPFYSAVHQEIIQQTRQCNVVLKNSHWSNVSQPAKDLILGLLTFRQDRMTLQQVINHEWLQNIENLKQYQGINKKVKKQKRKSAAI